MPSAVIGMSYGSVCGMGPHCSCIDSPEVQCLKILATALKQKLLYSTNFPAHFKINVHEILTSIFDCLVVGQFYLQNEGWAQIFFCGQYNI